MLSADVRDCFSFPRHCCSSGHYYFVRDAYTSVTGKPCQLSTLRAKRRFDEDAQAWAVRVGEEAGVSPAEASVLLVGDTVATGTTLSGTSCMFILQCEQSSTKKFACFSHMRTLARVVFVCALTVQAS